MRDLELRGAGNLLGADQSGFASSDRPRRVHEATQENGRADREAGRRSIEWPVPDVTVAGASLSFPMTRTFRIRSQKLHLYRRLSKAETGEPRSKALRERARRPLRSGAGRSRASAGRRRDPDHSASGLGLERAIVRGRLGASLLQRGSRAEDGSPRRTSDDNDRPAWTYCRVHPLSMKIDPRGARSR